jgi:hypothetical protein
VLTLKDLDRQLESEITEEIGVGLTLSEVNTAPVCLILDGEARSLDLVMSVTMAARPKIIANWEYPATAWVTAEEFPQWSRKREVIGPTRTIMEWLSHRKPQGATN